MSPSITAVCPTTSRRDWCRSLSIECFLNQTLTDAELVVVSDGAPVTVPAHRRIRTLHLEGSPALGAKWNAGIAAARAAVVALWADDDFHHPSRLATSLAVLERERVEVVGTRELLFHELGGAQRTYLYRYLDARPFLLGGTLAFTREAWSRSPFPEDRHPGSDTYFAFDLLDERKGHASYALLPPAPALYVAFIHDDNCGRPRWEPRPPAWTELAAGYASTVMGGELARWDAAYAAR